MYIIYIFLFIKMHFYIFAKVNHLKSEKHANKYCN